MKPANADDIKKREIRLIKIAQRELNMEDSAYRDLLWALARVKSATELDWTGRKKVLDHFKACGFKIKSSPANKSANDAEYRKVRALWTELHKLGAIAHDTDHAVRAYVERMTKKSDFAFVNSFQSQMVIESLKKWIARVEKEKTNV